MQIIYVVVGLILGVAIGFAQLYLLSRYVNRITDAGKDTESGDTDSAHTDGADLKAFGLGMAQMFLPFLALVVIAFAWRSVLMWAGIGAGTGLAIGAIVLFVRRTSKK
jgi:hypothetical protein